MQSPNKKLHVTGANDSQGLPIAPELWLSLATGSLLLGILALKATSESLQAISQASLEVLRGDRLPVLHLRNESTERVPPTQDVAD